MKESILRVVGKKRNNHKFKSTQSIQFVIIDWSNHNNTGVNLHEELPVVDTNGNEMKGVFISNENQVKVECDLLENNALPINNSTTASQCECILYPHEYKQEEWILLIETKYITSEKSIEELTNKTSGYPFKMLSQLVSTAEYFRSKNVINDQLIYAALSIPNQIAENFSGFMLTADDIENYVQRHKLLVGVTNNVYIHDRENLDFSEVSFV